MIEMRVEFYFDTIEHEVEFIHGLDEMYSAYKFLLKVGCTLDYKKAAREFMRAAEKVAKAYEHEESRVD